MKTLGQQLRMELYAAVEQRNRSKGGKSLFRGIPRKLRGLLRTKLQRRGSRTHLRRRTLAIYPPQQGHRRPEFSSRKAGAWGPAGYAEK